MNYQKILSAHHITDDDIQQLVTLFKSRATASDKSNCLPDAIYESAAIDIAMGAIDLSQETQEAMKEGHQARQWLHVLTGLAI